MEGLGSAMTIARDAREGRVRRYLAGIVPDNRDTRRRGFFGHQSDMKKPEAGEASGSSSKFL